MTIEPVEAERGDRNGAEGVGRVLLAGNTDAIKLNGIDRWLGGVHLVGETAAWRWDEETTTLRAGDGG